MARQYIVYGPLGPIYFNETNKRQYIAFGNYINETQSITTNVALTGQAITSGLGSVVANPSFRLAAGGTNLIPYCIFSGTTGNANLPTGWSQTGLYNTNLTLNAATTINNISTKNVSYRRVAGGGFQGFQPFPTLSILANTQETFSAYIRIPTGVTAEDCAIYTGSGSPGMITLATAATLNAATKDVWILYSVSVNLTKDGTLSIINNTVGGVGFGWDIALPQLEYGNTPNNTIPTNGTAISGIIKAISYQNSLSSNTNVALAGISTTSSLHSVNTNTNLVLTGQGVTAGAGSVSTVTSAPLAGQAATGGAGTVAAAASFGLAGLSLASGFGSLGFNFAIPLIGQQVTSSLGSIAISPQSFALTGQAVTSTQGSIAKTSSFALTGVSITSGQGTITAFSGITSVAITGLRITSSQGSLTVSTSALLVGQTVVFTQGTILPVISIGVTGISLTLTQKSIYGILFVPSGYRTYVITNQGRSLTIDLQNRTLAIDSQNRTLVITAQQRNITS